MSKIISNVRLSKDFYLMKVEEKNNSKMGQFYMLRAWDEYPVLSRPISIYDADESSVSFLYKVVGKGTEIFSRLKAGDEISLEGPLGTGFPSEKGKIALVGGGVGIAPFYLAAKELRKVNRDSIIDIYLGFSDVAILKEEFEALADKLVINVGGFITDDVNTEDYDIIMSCGPEIMMKTLYKKCEKQRTEDRLYVSMENRMACGIGACLVCTCKTKSGNKRACKEGPVMLGKEVFENEF